jgi:hypothetical protein
MADLEIGDTVEHIVSGRRGVVVALGKQWDGRELAFVKVHDPISGRVIAREYAVAGLRKVDR